MVKGISSLAAVKKIKAQELKQRQIINRDMKIEKTCKRVAKDCGISKPVNYTVNKTSNTSFKDINLASEVGEFAPWSPLSKTNGRKLNINV